MNSHSLLPNLSRFVPVSSAPPTLEAEGLTLYGDVLHAARLESERLNTGRSMGEPGQKVTVEALLGVISYCYVKGVVSSHEIEEHLWRNAAFLNAFGNNLPTAPMIQRFRRHHRRAILRTIERALQHFWSRRAERSPTEGTAAESAANEVILPRLRAEQLVDQAMLTDGLEAE